MTRANNWLCSVEEDPALQEELTCQGFINPTPSVTAEWNNDPSNLMAPETFVRPQGIQMHALVDSGATDCLLSSMFAAKMGLTPHWLANLLQLSNIDRTLVVL